MAAVTSSKSNIFTIMKIKEWMLIGYAALFVVLLIYFLFRRDLIIIFLRNLIRSDKPVFKVLRLISAAALLANAGRAIFELWKK
jgi:lipid-A-disaccharide synthase-like uncharacterized protein